MFFDNICDGFFDGICDDIDGFFDNICDGFFDGICNDICDDIDGFFDNICDGFFDNICDDICDDIDGIFNGYFDGFFLFDEFFLSVVTDTVFTFDFVYKALSIFAVFASESADVLFSLLREFAVQEDGLS